jgi:hypothetical protein
MRRSRSPERSEGEESTGSDASRKWDRLSSRSKRQARKPVPSFRQNRSALRAEALKGKTPILRFPFGFPLGFARAVAHQGFGRLCPASVHRFGWRLAHLVGMTNKRPRENRQPRKDEEERGGG